MTESQATHRKQKLRQARDGVSAARGLLLFAADTLADADPCFEEIRADLYRIFTQVEARERELITCLSAAGVLESAASPGQLELDDDGWPPTAEEVRRMPHRSLTPMDPGMADELGVRE